MEVLSTDFPGLMIVKPKVFADGRGFFMETWNEALFADHGLEYKWMQDNHARSETVGVLRGLHFQLPPSAQAKLVRVSRGKVFDVVVDLRVGSPKYGEWFGIELSAENKTQLLIPKGFAHGYATLSDVTEFQYKVDALYDPGCDTGILWNDPELGIDWPVREPVLSEKDRGLQGFAEFTSPFVFEG